MVVGAQISVLGTGIKLGCLRSLWHSGSTGPGFARESGLMKVDDQLHQRCLLISPGLEDST